MHVTKETAEKLAAAGYPKDVKTNDHGSWYMPDDCGGHLVGGSEKASYYCKKGEVSGAVYAPNVVELLQAMEGHSVALYFDEGKWVCIHHIFTDFPEKVFYHDNPAEALAKMYLHVNSKQ